MEGRPVYIYALVDPRTHKIRYVGKAIDYHDRYNVHIEHANRGTKRYVYDWIRKLLKLGLEPLIHIIDIVPEEDQNLAECAWIFHGRYEAGWELTNLTEGGDGGIPTEETRQKISKSNAGREVSEDTRRKLSEAGRNISDDTRRKRSISMSGERNHNYGATFSEETRDKLRNARLGTKLSEVTKEKMRKTRTGMKRSEEARRNISASKSGENNPMYGRLGEASHRFGVKHTEETKQKIRKSVSGKKLCAMCRKYNCICVTGLHNDK